MANLFFNAELMSLLRRRNMHVAARQHIAPLGISRVSTYIAIPARELSRKTGGYHPFRFFIDFCLLL